MKTGNLPHNRLRQEKVQSGEVKYQIWDERNLKTFFFSFLIEMQQGQVPKEGMSVLKAVGISGVIGTILSFIPFLGILICSIVAGYLTKRSLLRGAGIGILAGLVKLSCIN